jgi:hypothetical protein
MMGIRPGMSQAKSFKKVEILILADCHREDVQREIYMSILGGLDFHSFNLTGISADFMSSIPFEKGNTLLIHFAGNKYIGEVL